MFNQTYCQPSRAAPIAAFCFLTCAAVLSGCVGPYGPVREEVVYEPPRLPATEVKIAADGHSSRQISQDRYECYQWATKETGFDPGQLSIGPHARVDVTPVVPPANDTIAGAFTGAFLGALSTTPRHAAGGAVLGAIAGAAFGAASDSARQAEVDRLQRRYDARDQVQQAELERQAANYRRALSACFEGRGYVVTDRFDEVLR